MGYFFDATWEHLRADMGHGHWIHKGHWHLFKFDMRHGDPRQGVNCISTQFKPLHPHPSHHTPHTLPWWLGLGISADTLHKERAAQVGAEWLSEADTGPDRPGLSAGLPARLSPPADHLSVPAPLSCPPLNTAPTPTDRPTPAAPPRLTSHPYCLRPAWTSLSVGRLCRDDTLIYLSLQCVTKVVNWGGGGEGYSLSVWLECVIFGQCFLRGTKIKAVVMIGQRFLNWNRMCSKCLIRAIALYFNLL